MLDPTDARPTNVRALVITLLGFTSAAAYVTRYANSISSATIEHDLDLTHDKLGWVFAAFMVGYLLGQIPGASLGSRFGTRAALTGTIAAWSLSLAWSACSGSLVPLVASQFAFGLAQAGLVPITSIVVKDWFPVARRGFPSSIVTGAMSAGGVAAMWLTGQLLKWWHDDWQAVFWLYAVLGGVWAIVFWLLFRTAPGGHPWTNIAEVRLIAEAPAEHSEALPLSPRDGPSSRSARPQVSASSAQRDAIIRMATSLSAWALGLQWFFRSFGYQFFARWFPAFLQDRYQMDVADSGFYSAWPLFGVAIGSFMGGVIVDISFRKTGSRRISRNVTSLVTLLLCAACVGLAEFCGSGPAFAGLMAVGAVFSGISMPAGWAANLDIGGKDSPLLFAVMNMAATAAGIVAPPLVGRLMRLIQVSGGEYGTVVWLHVGIYVAAALAWLVINPERSIDRQDAVGALR